MGAIRSTVNFITGGYLDRRDAEKIVKSATRKGEKAKKELEKQKETTQKDLAALGEVKQQAFTESLVPFVAIYKEVGHVDLTPIKHIDSIDYRLFKCEYAELKQVTTTYSELALVGGGGALTGATAVGGALGLAALVGTASTGTAIGTLSGAAATNATLAWLGGGTLAAGGAGVVGGMVVLGGIAIAPLAIITMFWGASKGKQRLNAAEDYRDQVNVMVEKINTLVMELDRIGKGAQLFRKTIISLNELMKYQNSKMLAVIERLRERDLWHKFLIDPVKKLLNMQILTDEEAAVFRDTANCAYLLKKLVDTPLINEDGSFFAEATKTLETCRKLGVPLLEKNRMQITE